MVKPNYRHKITSISIALSVAVLGAACAPDVEPIDNNPTAADAADQSSEALRLPRWLGGNKPTTTVKPPVSATPAPPVSQAPATTVPTATTPPQNTPPAPAPTTTVTVPAIPNQGSYVAAGTRMALGGCPIYPRNNVFHADVRSLNKKSDSDLTIAAMKEEKVRGMSSVVWQGSRSGYPINLVDSRTTPPTPFYKQGFLLQKEPIGSFPIPANPKLEGDPKPAWDQHLIAFDTATCKSHELFLVRTPALSFLRTWEADGGWTLDMNSNQIPFAASTVSGFSLLAGLIRYEEVQAGSIDHVIGAAMPNTSTLPAVWPATRNDGRNSDPNAPRIGTWLRLKNVDLSQFGPTAQIVVKAMQKHGVIIQDTNHGGIALAGENDARWNDADLATLSKLSATDFDVVDPSPMIVSPNSYEIR